MSDLDLNCPLCGTERVMEEVGNFRAVWCPEDDKCSDHEVIYIQKQRCTLRKPA